MRILLCALIISSTYAQNRGEDARELFKHSPNFFDLDSARTSFQPEPQRLDGPEWGVFNANLKRESLKEKLRREEEEERKKQEALLASKMGRAEENTELTSAEDVLKRFGDPEKEPEVLAQKDAPKPFQGMMAALQIGDEKLAQQYARQYARYMKTTQERVTRTTNLTGLAMATDGTLDENAWGFKTASKADKELFREEIENLRNRDATNSTELSEKAKSLISVALEEEKENEASPLDRAEKLGFFGAESDQIAFAREQDRKNRLRARDLDVFLFIRPKDERANLAGSAFESLYQQFKQNRNLRFAVLSVGLSSESDRDVFRSITGLSLPIVDGSALAKELDVADSATVVFVSRSSGKAVKEIGRRGPAYLSERLKLILGGANG